MADPTWGAPKRVTDNSVSDTDNITTISLDGYATVVHNHDLGVANYHRYSKQQADPTASWGSGDGIRADTASATMGSVQGTCAVEDLSGTVHTVWCQGDGTGAIYVYYSKRTRGGVWSAPEQVTAALSPTETTFFPNLAIDGKGNLACLFSMDTDITSNWNWYTRYKAVGGAWGGQLTWTTQAAGGYQARDGCMSSSLNGDIWMCFDDMDSAVTPATRLKLYRLNSGLAGGTVGNWTSVRTYENATYMVDTAGPQPSLSAISRTDYLLTWNGWTGVAGTDKYYLFADWVIRGRSPAIFAGTMRAAALDNHARQVSPAYSGFAGRCALSRTGKLGIVTDNHTFHFDNSGNPATIRTFYLRNNVWSTAKTGPDTAVSPSASADTVGTPEVRFSGNADKAYMLWRGIDV